VSLTSSYGIALDYALYAGRNPASPARPAYVYEIEFSSDRLPVTLIDPVSEIAARDALGAVKYHHDGRQSFLLGVVSPSRMARHLTAPVVQPPPNLITPRPPNLSPELETLVRALRDAEILVHGAIPRTCITHRHDVH
jgi:hypothetical protein